jgi:hypothetical protein
MTEICLWSHMALIEINTCINSFPLLLIAHDLIRHSTQISQHYHRPNHHPESESLTTSEEI